METVLYIIFFISLAAGIIVGVLAAVYLYREKTNYVTVAAAEEDDEEDYEVEQLEKEPEGKRSVLSVQKEKESWTEWDCEEDGIDSEEFIKDSRKRETESYNFLKSKTDSSRIQTPEQMHPEMQTIHQQDNLNMLGTMQQMNDSFTGNM